MIGQWTGESKPIEDAPPKPKDFLKKDDILANPPMLIQLAIMLDGEE